MFEIFATVDEYQHFKSFISDTTSIVATSLLALH